MKLSQNTMNILKNFVNINTGIVLRKTLNSEDGSKIMTIDSSGSVVGRAIVEDIFENTAPIYNLKAFLSVLDSMNSPEIDFQSEKAVIKSDTGAVATVVYADENFIDSPKNDAQMDNFDYSFDMYAEDLCKTLSMSGILALPHIRFTGKDGKVTLTALELNNPNTNTFDVTLGDTDKDFSVCVKKSYVDMLLDGNYTVNIMDGKLAQFVNKQDTNISYFCALQETA